MVRSHISITQLAQRLLKLSGRDYKISPSIPGDYLVGEMCRRGIQLLRGLIRLRQRVFLDSSVEIRGARQLQLGQAVAIGKHSILDCRSDDGVSLGNRSRLGRFGVITSTSHLSLQGKGVRIGEAAGIGDFFHIGASGGVTIGRNVIAGPYLMIHSQNHVFDDPNKPIREQGTVQAEVVIGDDCWIGSRVTLLAGTILGPRTVVAAGSVVRGVHEGNEVIAGAPATRIRSI